MRTVAAYLPQNVRGCNLRKSLKRRSLEADTRLRQVSTLEQRSPKLLSRHALILRGSEFGDFLGSRSTLGIPVVSEKSICMDLQGIVDKACTASDPMIMLSSP